jgi:hypothetical protein
MGNLKALSTIGTAVATMIRTDSVVVATMRSTIAAPGILGYLGLTRTATTVISLPVVGVVTVAGLIGYGIYQGVKYAQRESEQ